MEVRTKISEAVKIAITGVYSENKRKLEETVGMLPFIELVAKLNHGPTVLVAASVNVPKYRQAREWGIQVVSLDWVWACQTANKLVSCAPFRLKPFTGLVICCTGLDTAERSKIEASCTSNGAKFSTELRRDECTHLLAMSTKGEKYQYAKEWGKQIVTPQWFFSSLEKQECLDEEQFRVKEYKSVFFAEQSLRPTTTKTDPVAETRALVPSIAPGKLHRSNSNSSHGMAAACAFNPDIKAWNENSVPWDSLYLSACCVHLYGFEQADAPRSSLDLEEHTRLRQLLCHGGAVEQAAPLGATHVVFSRRTETHSLASLSKVMAQRSDNKPIVVWPEWLAACGAACEEVGCDEFLVPANRYSRGGPRTKQLQRYSGSTPKTDSVAGLENDVENHKSETPPDLKPKAARTKQLKRYSSSEPSTDAAEGLDNNVEQTKSMLPSHFSVEPLDPKPRTGAASPALESNPSLGAWNMNGSPGHCPPGSAMSHLASSSRAMDLVQQPVNQTSLSASLQLDNLTSGVLHGLDFILSPLLSTRQRETVEEWLAIGGGQTLGLDASKVSSAKVYEVWPSHPAPSAGAHTVALFQDACNHTLPTSTSIPVTEYWLRRCTADGALHPPESNVLFAPLPCKPPLSGMQGVCVCVSMYVDAVREEVATLCELTGCKYSEVLKKRKTTHLVIREASGPKYKSAGQWGIQIVTKEWLDKCAAAGEMLPEHRFQPPAASVNSEVQRSQVPSLTHPAPSQPIPSSQVMPTQAGALWRSTRMPHVKPLAVFEEEDEEEKQVAGKNAGPAVPDVVHKETAAEPSEAPAELAPQTAQPTEEEGPETANNNEWVALLDKVTAQVATTGAPASPNGSGALFLSVPPTTSPTSGHTTVENLNLQPTNAKAVTVKQLPARRRLGSSKVDVDRDPIPEATDASPVENITHTRARTRAHKRAADTVGTLRTSPSKHEANSSKRRAFQSSMQRRSAGFARTTIAPTAQEEMPQVMASQMDDCSQQVGYLHDKKDVERRPHETRSAALKETAGDKCTDIEIGKKNNKKPRGAQGTDLINKLLDPAATRGSKRTRMKPKATDILGAHGFT